MRVQLVQVGERLSLEMDAAGLIAVKSYLERTFPDTTAAASATYSRIRFGGSEFLHENEWDDPCLLSQTPAGDSLLRSVAEHFS